MLHFLSAIIGYLILSYDISNYVVKNDYDFYYTFSSWFLILTTLFHTVQIFTNLWYAFAYPIVSFALFFMIPSAFFTLTTPESSLIVWIMYDLIVHLILPIYAITHLDNVTFKGSKLPFLISSVYFISYIIFIEMVANPLPYMLNTQSTIIRILIYIAAFIIQCLGILLITRIPYLKIPYIIPV